jgi:hypothetical protein
MMALWQLAPFCSFLQPPCSFGLSAISQRYFSLTTNRPNLCGIELCIYKLNSLFVWLVADGCYWFVPRENYRCLVIDG